MDKNLTHHSGELSALKKAHPSNNGYSTLFTCIVAPILLCIMHINWNLYPLALFRIILCLIPDIIVDNPLIFIYMTISNIIYIYIACSSFSVNISLKNLFRN